MLYDYWVRFSWKIGYLKKYHKETTTALLNAKEALEEAFSPQLQKLIEDGWCSECGVYRGEDK